MMQNNRIKVNEEAEDNLIQEFVSKYMPYWPMFVIAVIISISIAVVYLHWAIPVYEANATIIIKDEKKGNEDSKLMESLDQISSKKIVENEIEILQSRTLMLDVVKDLGLYAPVYDEGKVNSISAYVLSPISIVSPSPDSMETSDDKIYFTYNGKNQTVLLNNKYSFSLNQIVKTPYGILKFFPNPNFEPDANNNKQKFYFELLSPPGVASSLLSGLKAEASSKLSSVIELSFRDQVPKRAEDILNQLLHAYDLASIAEKDKLASNTLSFVQVRLSAVAHDLDSIEKKIQQYKSGRDAVDVSAQGQLFLQNVSANDQKIGELSTQQSVLNQVEKFVANNENNSAIVPSTVGVSDPMLTQLMDKLYNAELEYDKLRKTVGENNPSLIALRDQISKIKPSILQNIHSQQQSLYAAKQNLNATNGTYNSILQTVPQKERDLLDISREQSTMSAIYAFLLQKKEESELSHASTLPDHRIVDSAETSGAPVSPKRMLIYIVSIVACLGLCFAIIMVRESLTGKVLYRSEIESRTSIPIIGEIAFDKSKTPLVVEAGKRSFIAEEFRKLRISLSFLGIDEKHKKILVTSSISGEGKSFIAANLAVSLSLTGKKVVIVDLDLNNPTIAKILNVTQEDGITEFLTGQKEPEEIIKRVKAHENLFFISAGNLPENPTELLANGKVNEIIEYLDNIFDIVIIDTSPIVLVTDGYLLTGLCDTTLYVIRHKYTPKIIIKRIDERNQINPINNPAIIFNGVKIRGFFKNNYGYGYDYVYGNKERANYNRKQILK
jgi:tyrosine-protein kinase Etk/Wzc